jgi:hypothetical protein
MDAKHQLEMSKGKNGTTRLPPACNRGKREETIILATGAILPVWKNVSALLQCRTLSAFIQMSRFVFF